MYILTRKIGQPLSLVDAQGKYIEITVIETHGDEVRLGVHAPALVSAHRPEYWEPFTIDSNEGAP